MFPQSTWPMMFETERLYARRPSSADAAEMVEIFGDVETMRYVGDGKTLNESDCIYWVDDVTAKNFELRGYGLIGIFDKETSKLVACTGVFHPGQQAEPEVMYYLRREYWGRGYATEIVLGLVRYARDTWGAGRMIATIHPDHSNSQRVITKCGFSRAEDRKNEDGTVTQVWELC